MLLCIHAGGPGDMALPDPDLFAPPPITDFAPHVPNVLIFFFFFFEIGVWPPT